MPVTLAIDPGVKNIAVCVADGVEVRCWEVLDLVPGVKAPSIERIIAAAVPLVERLRATFPEASVRIEQQPSKNIKMKVLGHALQALFLAGGSEVAIVSPKTYKTVLDTYYKRKKDSVARVQTLLDAGHLTGSDEVLGAWEGRAKRDDLAGAALLALWGTESAEQKAESP